MKHLHFIIFSLCTVLYCACSTIGEGESIEPNEVSAYIALANEIENIQIQENISRGTSRPTFGKWLRTVTTDMVTGLKFNNPEYNSGDIVKLTWSSNGSIQSYKKYVQNYHHENLQNYSRHRIFGFPSINDSTTWVNGTFNREWADSIMHGDRTIVSAAQHGYLHNKIITDLYVEFGDSIFLYPSLKVDSLLHHKLNAYSNLEYQTPTTTVPTDTVLVNNILQICDASENLTECFSSLIELFPDQTNELIVLKAIMEKLYTIDIETEQGEFFLEVLSILSNANIPDTSKYMITSSLSIANASMRLWNMDSY